MLNMDGKLCCRTRVRRSNVCVRSFVRSFVPTSPPQPFLIIWRRREGKGRGGRREEGKAAVRHSFLFPSPSRSRSFVRSLARVNAAFINSMSIDLSPFLLSFRRTAVLAAASEPRRRQSCSARTRTSTFSTSRRCLSSWCSWRAATGSCPPTARSCSSSRATAASRRSRRRRTLRKFDSR